MIRSTLKTVIVIALTAAAAGVAFAQAGGSPTAPPAPTATAVPATGARATADQVVEAVWQWNLNKAKNILENTKTRDGADPAYKGAQGFVAAADGKVSEGAAQLSAQAKTAGAGAEILFLQGEVLYWQQKYGEADAAWRSALQRAQQAVAATPADAHAQFYLGAASARLKKFSDATKALDRAGALGFSRQLVLYQKGVAATLQQDWSAAATAFDQLESLEPRFAYLFFYRGLANGKLGRKDRMLNDLDTFVKLAPTAPDAATARSFLAAGKR